MMRISIVQLAIARRNWWKLPELGRSNCTENRPKTEYVFKTKNIYVILCGIIKT